MSHFVVPVNEELDGPTPASRHHAKLDEAPMAPCNTSLPTRFNCGKARLKRTHGHGHLLKSHSLHMHPQDIVQQRPGSAIEAIALINESASRHRKSVALGCARVRIQPQGVRARVQLPDKVVGEVFCGALECFQRCADDVAMLINGDDGTRPNCPRSRARGTVPKSTAAP